MFGRIGSGRRVWARFAAIVAQTIACRSEPQHTPTWWSDGGALGQRVRDGGMAGVTHVRFVSKVLKRDVGAVVVTPPEYAQQAERRYPAVYLYPGIGGDEWTYLRDGGLEGPTVRALFADPTRAPLLVFGNPGDSGGDPQARVVLAEELVSLVDRQFRTDPRATARSLEGFSLGGATALNLLLHRPDVFGQAVALSSACYLLPTCDALRKSMIAQARLRGPGVRVMLGVGEREDPKNREISQELASVLRVPVEIVAGADHNWSAQLATRSAGRTLGERIADFHLSGMSAAQTQ